MPKLAWRLHNNPLYDSTSAQWFDFDHTPLSAAGFTTYANGGFGEGQITVVSPGESLIRKFIDNGLMKRVTATDGAGRVAYEGFIAEIHAVLNHHAYVRTMDDFANRVFVQYKYTNGGCPKGSSCTGKLQRDESDVSTGQTQTEYGIKEAWVNITGDGIMTSTMATDAADIALGKMLRARAIDFALGETEPRDNALTLVFWGYYSTLQWRHYTRSFSYNSDIGTIVSTALAFTTAIVGHPGNGGIAPFISSDHSNIQTIGNSVKFNKEAKPIVLQDYIRGAMTAGDGNGKQLFFQILEDRKPYLFPRAAVAKYFSTQDFSRAWNADHKQIPLYMVRAGGVMVSESINSLAPINDVVTHERSSLIESTTYDDIAEKLNVPPPSSVITPERLFARAVRLAHRNYN